MLQRVGIVLTSILTMSTCALAETTAAPARAPLRLTTVAAPAGVAPAARSATWLIHLPGISGRQRIDTEMALGFRDAGFAGLLQFYDWTGPTAGLGALYNYQRNLAEAQKVADYITERAHAEPAMHIIITSHSGGTGIAVWALERLPADVKVDTLLLMASALSPDYDLSKALSHVKNHCYAFISENDVIVLGEGTKMLGTIDRKKTEAAGHVGFTFPKDADPAQYEKLIQKPYNKAWVKYENIGDHMSCLFRPFAGHIIAPLLWPEEKTAKTANSQGAPQQPANRPARS